MNQLESNFDYVIICVDSDEDLKLCERTAALYFPRTPLEVDASVKGVDRSGRSLGDTLSRDVSLHVEVMMYLYLSQCH